MMQLTHWFSLPLLLSVSACTTLLPQSHTDSTTFKDYDDARNAISALVPMKSDRRTLKMDGFDPATYPNTKMLTHSDVVRLLIPASVLRREDLDPGILVCMEARDTCTGMEIVVARISRKRTGNFFADFSNFQRRTETTGWRFNALVLFVKDLVVYRSWGGQPDVSELEVNFNPLGPFQDIGPSMLSTR